MTTQPAPDTRLALFALPAEIDVTNALRVYDLITAAALKPGVTIVIADMAATQFCDATGLRFLLLASEFAARHGARLRVLMPGHNVRRVIELQDVGQALTICESVAEAMTP